MPPPYARITVWRLMVLVAIAAAFLATIGRPIGRRLEYARVQREMDDAIRALEYRVPPGVSPSVWECAWGWTLTAYGNVCFSEEHVRIGEMYRLRDELMPKLSGPVGPQTLVWIWDRLAKTGPHGGAMWAGSSESSSIASHRGWSRSHRTHPHTIIRPGRINDDTSPDGPRPRRFGCPP